MGVPAGGFTETLMPRHRGRPSRSVMRCVHSGWYDSLHGKKVGSFTNTGLEPPVVREASL